ncbi:MAG: hypothetical protein JSS36_12530 [Proteobacteria bacterium]|nr:hypothetical protein [Pseudomonadota bacterium]
MSQNSFRAARTPLGRIFARLRALAADTTGNVLMWTGLSIIPMMFVFGFSLDYARAERARTLMNAAADAAVLSAVDPTLLVASDSSVQASTIALFKSQAASIKGVTLSSDPTVTVTPITASGASSSTGRTVTLTYRATNSNVFGSIFKGMGINATTLPITGSATASASLPPSIDFFIALDVSPSMLISTTSTGIANLNAGARWDGAAAFGWIVTGCTFACHSNNSHQWNYGMFPIDANGYSVFLPVSSGSVTLYRVACNGNVYNQSGTQIGSYGTINTAWHCSGTGPAANPVTLRYLPSGMANVAGNYVNISVNFPDTWWLARNYATVNPGQSQIQLRIDAEGTAAQGLLNYAYNYELNYANASVPPKYRMKFYTFAYGTPAPISTSPFGTMTDVATSHNTSFPDLGAQAPLMYANSYWTDAATYTGNADTQMTTMLNTMQSVMPATAGNGAQATPQDVLVIITDGANDDNGTLGPLTASQISQCTAIKNTGARIAILYTEYAANTITGTSHPTFNSFAANSIPNILPQLQACASQNPDGSYLLQTVTANQDLSAALNALFAATVKTAVLTK